MSTARSIGTLLAVVATIGVVVAPLSGCAARRKAREAQSVERTYAKTAFMNETGMGVRISVVIGERVATPPGVGTTYRAEPQLIAAGGTYQALIQEKKPYGVGFLFPDNQDLVVRFKLESSGATWEPTQFAWYEVIGPLPETIRIVSGDGGAPMAAVDAGRVELVPREWWPKE